MATRWQWGTLCRERMARWLSRIPVLHSSDDIAAIWGEIAASTGVGERGASPADLAAVAVWPRDLPSRGAGTRLPQDPELATAMRHLNLHTGEELTLDALLQNLSP